MDNLAFNLGYYLTALAPRVAGILIVLGVAFFVFGKQRKSEGLVKAGRLFLCFGLGLLGMLTVGVIVLFSMGY